MPEKTQPGRLLVDKYMEKAKEYSVSVAAKLSMLVLQKGVIGILGL